MRMFERLGAKVLSADAIVHELLRRPDIARSVAGVFGPEVLRDGVIDRKRLSEKVFSDRAKREMLEGLLHPLVLERVRLMKRRNPEDIIVAEVPLLYEAGFDRDVDAAVVVTADEDVVRRRLEKKGFSVEEIDLRRAAQLSLEEKAERADYVIDNSGSLEETERQVRAIWEDLSGR